MEPSRCFVRCFQSFLFLKKKEKKEPKINNRFRFVGTFVNGNGNNAITIEIPNIIEEI